MSQFDERSCGRRYCFTTKPKSGIEKKAHKGKNVGHGGFDKVAKKAAKEYGSKEAGKKVAAAAMWKGIHRK